MKIDIKEPCHENWEAMTPNQQGAFCGSCQKDVVDFSKMSLQGIKNFFSKPQNGKVCGRFEEKQLQELSFDDFFAKFTYWNFSKKFAVIFFMAFGFWIFSNSGAMAQTHHLQGAVVAEPPPAVQKDTAQSFLQGQPVIMGKPAIKPEPAIKMGKIKCVKPEPKTEEKEKKEPKQKVQPPPPHIMGAVAIPQEKKTPPVQKTPVEKKEKKEKTQKPLPHIMGDIAMPEEKPEEKINTAIPKSDTE